MDKKNQVRKSENKRDVTWHIYHTILALLLAGVLIVEIIELCIK